MNGFTHLSAPPVPSFAPAQVKPFPLVPSAYWDNPKSAVLWSDIHVFSKFGRAILSLKFPHRVCKDGRLECATNLEDLAIILIRCWELH